MPRKDASRVLILLALGAQKLSDPQSWNQYAYARNNLLLYTDPDGSKYQICDSTSKCSKDQLSDEEFESERSKAQKNGEYFTNGTLYHFDANGNKVSDGTYRQEGRIQNFTQQLEKLTGEK